MLNGKQRQHLVEALLHAFPNYPMLEQMVSFEMDENLAAIAGAGPQTDVAFTLVKWAEAEGRVGRLIVAARNKRPNNPKLRAFLTDFLADLHANPLDPEKRALAEEIEVAPTLDIGGVPAPAGELEKILIKSVQFNDPEEWRQRMAKCELTVCRIESPTGLAKRKSFGTGFLLGPDLVMTNYHVVAEAVKDPASARQLVMLFDYKLLPDGTAFTGLECRLKGDGPWLVDYSTEDELDYALLRAEGTPGQLPAGGEHGATQRGWLVPTPLDLEPGEPLIVIQHPEASRQKVTLGYVIGLQPDRGYVTHTANTLGGSSGAPCFNSDWELVALHHWGSTAVGNRGITFSAIMRHLTTKGLAGVLGK